MPDHLPTTTTTTFEDWQALAASELRGKPLESLTRANDDGIPIPPLFMARDLEGLPHLGSLPGCAPYTRGAFATPQPWQVPVAVTAADLDSELRDVAWDGADGAAPGTGTFLQLGAEFASRPLLERLLRALRARGLDPLQVRGTIAFDPLGDWAAASEALEPWEQTRAESEPYLRFVAAELPLVRAIQVQSQPYQSLGAGPAHELGYVLAAGIEYLRSFAAHGLAVDLIDAHLAFQLAVSSDVLQEIAKLRAARLCWSQVARAFGVVHKSSLQMHLEAVASDAMLTQRDPHSNLVRTAIAGFAAACAGCEAITIPPFDRGAGGGSDADPELAFRLARNQHRLMRHEARLADVVDPLGGAYAIEALTDRVARAAWATMQRVEAGGGLAQGLQNGTVQKELLAHSARMQADVATGRRRIVGTSAYVGDTDVAERVPAGGAPRRSDPFDRLRAMVGAHRARTGRTALVAIHLLDQDATARARADFARDLFRAAGLIVTDAIDPQVASDVVVACLGPDSLAKAIAWLDALPRRGGRPLPYFAGPQHAQLRARGFLQPGIDAVAFLTGVLRELGMEEAR